MSVLERVNEISIGTPKTENNLPMDADKNCDAKRDTSGHGKPRPAHMVGRRLPINSFWMGLLILALGWIIQIGQLKDDGMSITINQTVITDNPTLIVKGSITGVHNKMARLHDLPPEIKPEEISHLWMYTHTAQLCSISGSKH